MRLRNPFTGQRLLRWYAILVLVFLMAPIAVVIGASFNSRGFLSFPPEGLSFRWYRELAGDASWWEAGKNSVLLALFSTMISLGLGTAAAFAVASRREWRGSQLYSGVMVLPLAFPFTATGVAVVGTLQTWSLVGSFKGFLVAHILVTLPFAYRAVLVSIQSLNRSYYEAALMHGATEVQAFWRVVMPLLRPGLVSGGVFAFLMSFDETTISMLLAGPFTTTLPVKMFSSVVDSADPIVAAVSTVQVVIVGIVLLVTQRLFGLKLFTENH